MLRFLFLLITLISSTANAKDGDIACNKIGDYISDASSDLFNQNQALNQDILYRNDNIKTLLMLYKDMNCSPTMLRDRIFDANRNKPSGLDKLIRKY